MALQLSSRLNDILESNAKLKQVKVVVCTETCTFNGYTHCMNHQRLLDALNQDSIANAMPIGKDFLRLTNVEVSFPNGKVKSMAAAYVRKTSILFVGENSEGQPCTSEIKDGSKIYRMRPKTPIGAEVHMPLFNLKGQMYGEAWQQMLDVIDRADKFLPLTNAEIYPAHDNTALTFDFVAVNRDKIIYVCES